MSSLIDRAKKFEWVEVVTTQGNVRQVPRKFESDPLSRSVEFLHSEGFNYSEISKLMWIRPQMVRNYLVGSNVEKIKLS